jgi:two-component system sensor histidine kinase KdpD
LFLLITPFTGYQAISLLYLLLVVMSGMKLRRGPTVVVAASSAVCWNLLFIPPRFTFYIDKIHNTIMFSMFFVVALAMGHLTNRLRRSEIAQRKKERRTAAMYELVHQAAFATDLITGLRAAVQLIESIFGRKAALLLRDKDHKLCNTPHPASSFNLSKKEKNRAARVFSQTTCVENSMAVLTDSEAFHLPLQGRAAVMGVLSVSLPPGRSFDRNERELLETFALLIGLILERII